MAFLSELWLPILVSAIFVFVVSSVIHMALPIHKSDYKKLTDEDGLMNAVRSATAGPGEYMFPRCESMKDSTTPEFVAKLKRGPVGVIIVGPSGPMNMGKFLGLWFVLCIVIGVFVAYVCRMAVGPSEDPSQVFRIATACAFLGHGFGSVCNSIWKFVQWSTTAKFIFDGVLYALVTGAAFAWLWPTAA